MSVSLFLLNLTTLLLIKELPVSADLFLLNAFFELSCLFDFLLIEQLDVLVLEVLVHASLLNFSALSRILLLQLLVQLLLDQSLSFAITQDRLLLLLVVKQGVELLDGGPLILLLNLRVYFGLGSLRAGSPALSVELLGGSCVFPSSPRQARGTRYVRASDGSRFQLLPSHSWSL